MNLAKNTTLRAILKGIYVELTFDKKGQIQNYKELYTNYLDDVSIDVIKSLVDKSKSTVDGKFKAVLTISRDNIYDAYTDLSLSLEETIANCLNSNKLRYNIKLVICGNIDTDIDTYDELNECNICKYFTEFYRVPKLKLNVDIDALDLKMIISHWINNYFFDTILINGITKFSLYSIADSVEIDESTIRWINGNPYYRDSNSLRQSLNLVNLIATKNNQLADSKLYMINNKYIGNSIL